VKTFSLLPAGGRAIGYGIPLLVAHAMLRFGNPDGVTPGCA